MVRMHWEFGCCEESMGLCGDAVWEGDGMNVYCWAVFIIRGTEG